MKIKKKKLIVGEYESFNNYFIFSIVNIKYSIIFASY